MGLEQIVNVNITRQTQGISQEGFGTPLILGPNGTPGEINTYSSVSAVAEDYALTDPEYLKAVKIFSQQPKVPQLKIGPASLPIAQVITMTPTPENNGEYDVGFGTELSPTAGPYTHISVGTETAAVIVEGLKRLINGEEVQLIEFSLVPDAGSFFAHFGTESVEIDFDDNAAAVQTKLRTLTGLEACVVTGDFTGGFEVVFRGYVGDAPLIAISDNTLQDTPDPVVISVSVVTEGEEQPHGVTATGTNTLILTANVPGVAFLYFNSVNIAAVVSTPSSPTIAAAILSAIDIDNDWYFLHLVPEDEATVLLAAETIEALKKIYIFKNQDADVRTSADDDLMSQLQAASYFRTAMFYNGHASEQGEAAFTGKFAPLNPGSETWVLKTLAGVTFDNWTDSEINFLKNKNANYYIRRAGKNISLDGKVAGGEFIDIIRFVDWLATRIQESVFGDLTRLDKIPFTDPGIAIIETAIRRVLQLGQTPEFGGIAPDSVDADGNIVPGFTITVPKAADVPINDKAARHLTGVSFTAKLSGAIHAVTINGVVTL